MNLRLAICLLLLVQTGSSAVYYVSADATAGANNGTNWANAWTNVTRVSGVSAGDIVYISGGASGATQTYTLTNNWTPAGGVSGNPITYKIGQDPAHNGTATFIYSGQWLWRPDHVILSGDAGDGQMHFALNCFGVANLDSSTNVTISYVNMGSLLWQPLNGNPCHQINIDHFWAYLADPTSDHFSYMKFQYLPGFDQNSIRDGTIYLPRAAGSGIGTDCFQWSGYGYTISNVTIIGYATNYTGEQHQDGLQDNGGSSYVKVCNNVIVNMGNSAMFQNAVFGSFSHMHIYNNIVMHGGGGIQIPSFSDAEPWLFDDVVVANNIVADTYLGAAALSIYSATLQPDTFTNCRLHNNVVVNGGWTAINTQVVSGFNVNMSSAQAATNFVSYTALADMNNNFRLRSTALDLIGSGTNLSAYFTTDKDGVLRDATWDIGAYEYVSTAINAGTVNVGTITLAQ